MDSQFDNPGVGFATFMLSMNTLLMLEKKGLFTSEDTKEVVEQALLNLETHEALAGPTDRKISKDARALLEQFRTLLGRPSEQR